MRIVLAMLLVLASAPPAARAAEVVPLSGTLEVTAHAPGSLVVDVRRPLEAYDDPWESHPTLEVSFPRRGLLSAVVLRRDTPGMYAETLFAVGSHERAYWNPVTAFDIRPGRYRLYVLTEGPEVTVRLQVSGEPGLRSVTADGPARFALEPFRSERVLGVPTAWAAATSSGPGLFLGRLRTRSGGGLQNWCWSHGEEADEAATYGPAGCSLAPRPASGDQTLFDSVYAPAGPLTVGFGGNFAHPFGIEFEGVAGLLDLTPVPTPDASPPAPVALPDDLRLLGHTARVRRGRAWLRLRCSSPTACSVRGGILPGGRPAEATIAAGKPGRLGLPLPPGRRRGRASVWLATGAGEAEVRIRLRAAGRRR